MPSGFYTWDQTAASNATADSSIGWSEGQAPSSVNDSARAMMSVQAKWRDDISGALVTGGTDTAFTVTSYSAFDSLAHMGGQMIAFSPHASNTGAATLNVDGLGAKPLRSAPSVELPAGTIIEGSPYVALYNHSDQVFYLHGFFGNPYGIPIGSSVEYWGTSVPNSSFVFPIGQAISRTTYSVLFSIFSTTYGAGDGTTTFNVPDPTGRVTVMKEASATRLTSTYFGGNSTVMGATGGSESHTLTTAQLATHSHANSLNDPGHVHTVGVGSSGGGTGRVTQGVDNPGANVVGPVLSAATGMTITNANAGSGDAHNNVQPTIICNRILRII